MAKARVTQKNIEITLTLNEEEAGVILALVGRTDANITRETYDTLSALGTLPKYTVRVRGENVRIIDVVRKA